MVAAHRLVGASLLVLPDHANLLRVHVVHGQQRLAPVSRPVGQRTRLLAIEHGMRLLHLSAGLLDGHREEQVTAALMRRPFIVPGRDARDALHHLLHHGARDNIATTTVGKGLVVDHGDTTNVGLALGRMLPQPDNEVGPDDVGIGLSKHIPVHVRALLPGALDHVEELVLVQVPGTLDALGAGVLGDGARRLGAVQGELAVGLADGVVDAVEDVLQVVLADLLLKVGEDEEVRQALHAGEQVRRDLGEALGGARLHDEQDAPGVGEALAGRAEVELGVDDGGAVAVLVERVVVDGLVVGQVPRDVVVDVLLVAGRRLVVAELPERHGEEQRQEEQQRDPPAAARGRDHGRREAVDARIALMHAEFGGREGRVYDVW